MSYDNTNNLDALKQPMTQERFNEMLKEETFKQHFQDKIELDENGRRLSRKPNKGFKLGSYKYKSKNK